MGSDEDLVVNSIRTPDNISNIKLPVINNSGGNSRINKANQ